MRLLVVGTVPVEDGPVLLGPVLRSDDGVLQVGDASVADCQGTASMLLAAEAVARHFDVEGPWALLAGDIGRGDGTRSVYSHLGEALERSCADVLAFHYLQPIMALMRESIAMLEERVAAGRLTLIADAGGMYAAKSAGLARHFELMTPDVGELGFLADPKASHPAYVGRYLFGNEEFDPVTLARKAAESGGAARILLIKGATDYLAVNGTIEATIDSPDVPALEAIGGTGDTITGLAAAFMAMGLPTVDAAVCAARANREAGSALGARPDNTSRDLVERLPSVLDRHLCAWQRCVLR